MNHFDSPRRDHLLGWHALATLHDEPAAKPASAPPAPPPCRVRIVGAVADAAANLDAAITKPGCALDVRGEVLAAGLEKSLGVADDPPTVDLEYVATRRLPPGVRRTNHEVARILMETTKDVREDTTQITGMLADHRAEERRKERAAEEPDNPLRDFKDYEEFRRFVVPLFNYNSSAADYGRALVTEVYNVSKLTVMPSHSWSPFAKRMEDFVEGLVRRANEGLKPVGTAQSQSSGGLVTGGMHNIPKASDDECEPPKKPRPKKAKVSEPPQLGVIVVKSGIAMKHGPGHTIEYAPPGQKNTLLLNVSRYDLQLLRALGDLPTYQKEFVDFLMGGISYSREGYDRNARRNPPDTRVPLTDGWVRGAPPIQGWYLVHGTTSNVVFNNSKTKGVFLRYFNGVRFSGSVRVGAQIESFLQARMTEGIYCHRLDLYVYKGAPVDLATSIGSDDDDDDGL